MIDYIIITANINIIEALKISNYGSFKNPYYNVNGMKTYELKDIGIREISVWADMKKVFTEPSSNRNCMFSATIDGVAFMQNGKENYTEVIDRIEAFLPPSFERKGKLEWKVKSASFVYNFTGYNIYEYYMFLRSGYDLSNINMEKTTEKIKNEEAEFFKMTFSGKGGKPRKKKDVSDADVDENVVDEKKLKESLAIEISLDYRYRAFNEPPCQYDVKRLQSNRLQIKIKIKKKKMLQLCKDYGITDRDFTIFMNKVNSIDGELFSSYLGRIAGQGNYYRYDEAEGIIMASEHTRAEKSKMCDALKGVASYKGISNYLSHVEDAEIRYECMRSMRKREYAQVALRNLQKLGINPLNISTHNKMVQGSLMNLVDVYTEANPYELIKKVVQKPITKEAVMPVPIGPVQTMIKEHEEILWNFSVGEEPPF